MDSDDELDKAAEARGSAPLKSNSVKKLGEAWLISTAPAKVTLANDVKHANKCKAFNCIRCSYVSRGSELASLSPMQHPVVNIAGVPSKADKLHASKGCWLASAKVDGNWGLGCIACCAKGLPGAFGTFSWAGAGATQTLKKSKLRKHHDSQEHIKAVAEYFGVKDKSLGAPPAEDMLEQLRILMEGKAGRHGSKSLAMTWCLKEALLDIDREFVRRAKTMSLCRDDRKQRLLMRFYGATAELDVRAGVLGIGTAHQQKPDADGLVAATKQVLEAFCIARKGAPVHGDGPYDVEEQLDEKLLKHLTSIIEVIAVDEESAELKASDIGRGRRNSALELAPITPNLKFVTRDKAHGFRRNCINKSNYN